MKYKKNIKKILAAIGGVILPIRTDDIYKDHTWLDRFIRIHRFFQKTGIIKSFAFLVSELSAKVKREISSDPTSFIRIKSTLIDLFHKGSEEERFYLVKLFYYFGVMDNEVVELILCFAKNTASQKYRYWTTMDISRFTFHLQSGFYEQYYIDRRELLKTIANEMELSIPCKRENSSNSLCIITHLLDTSLKNSVQRIAAMISGRLIPYYDEITIVPLDVFSPTQKESQELTTVLPYRPSYSIRDGIERHFSEGVRVYYTKGADFKEKMQNALNYIYSYSPKAILDISDEYSAISYYYSKDFFTVYLPMRDTNSSMFFDAIVGAPKWKFEITNNIYHSIDMKKVKNWVFPEGVPEKRIVHSREDLGIPENDFVLVSIGNNASTFSLDFVETMCKLIAKNHFVWVLVGQGAPESMKTEYKELIKNRRIIEYGYEDNLYSLCSICDVYVRPNTTGGSGATAIAAMAGLPIAMTNYKCDPSRWLGLDFMCDINDYQQLATYIERLSVDSLFYEEEKQKCLDLVNKALDTSEKWSRLIEILNQKE